MLSALLLFDKPQRFFETAVRDENRLVFSLPFEPLKRATYLPPPIAQRQAKLAAGAILVAHFVVNERCSTFLVPQRDTERAVAESSRQQSESAGSSLGRGNVCASE